MDFGDIVEFIENVPILGFVIKLLKKIGFFKDYERLYHTENKLKALGNAFRKINVPFQEILYQRNIKIPCMVLFRQKDTSTFTSSRLIQLGFIISSRSMGMYILPPLKVIEYKLIDRDSIERFLIEKGLTKDTKINIRACILFDLNKDYFSFRHPDTANEENKPIFDLILPQIMEYLGAKKSILFAEEYYMKSKKIKEIDLISSTPLQHIFADFLDEETFNLLIENEDKMIKYLIEKNYLSEVSFLALSKIKEDSMRETFEKFLGTKENIGAIISNAKKQSEFIANRI
jgi:hypothetical protein